MLVSPLLGLEGTAFPEYVFFGSLALVGIALGCLLLGVGGLGSDSGSQYLTGRFRFL